jgi:Transglycosylase SLT domain
MEAAIYPMNPTARRLATSICVLVCLGLGCGGGASEAQDTGSEDALPAPAAPLPASARGLAEDLTRTTLRLRREIGRWRTEGDPSRGGPPRAVTLLALRHQRLHRFVADDPTRARQVLALLPPSVRGEAHDTVAARRALFAIPVTPGAKTPPIRLRAAEPAGALRAHYLEAQRRFGIHWSVLAALNFVESAFGRITSASSAGAQGPMQFIPSTWAAYGMGGDINDPRDAILGAANYLRSSGAPRNLERALFAYNHSTAYVRAILRYARRIQIDERAFYTYYAWQVYVAGPKGVARRVTGPR